MVERALKHAPAPQPSLALPDAIDLVRFERNLLSIGFFGAHERSRKKKISDFSRTIEQTVNRDSKRIRVSAEFRSALGLPSSADRDKYMAFMKLAMERKLIDGQITNPIRFSGYQMLKTLGMSLAGQNYEEINQWGMRMADTTITSRQTIYSTSRKQFMNETVHVFRNFKRVGESKRDGSEMTVEFSVELEDWLLENLNGSYVVPEDFTQYRKLARPISKGIFVYLYVWFYASRGKDIEKDYEDLCSLLNIKCQKHASKVREIMGPSLDDLTKIKYLKKWDVVPMSSKRGFKLILSPGRAILDVIASTQRRQITLPTTDPALLSIEQEEIRQALLARGVSGEKAKALSRLEDPAVLCDKLEYLEEEIDRGVSRIKNPAGFIIRFLEEGNALPPTFVSAARKREAHRQAKEEFERQDQQKKLELAEAHLRDRYNTWCDQQADDAIGTRYPSEDQLDEKLREIKVEAVKDQRVATMFSRMKHVHVRVDLLRLLRSKVKSELQLISYEDWCIENGQGQLF
jgi:Replication initiator protein A